MLAQPHPTQQATKVVTFTANTNTYIVNMSQNYSFHSLAIDKIYWTTPGGTGNPIQTLPTAMVLTIDSLPQPQVYHIKDNLDIPCTYSSPIPQIYQVQWIYERDVNRPPEIVLAGSISTNSLSISARFFNGATEMTDFAQNNANLIGLQNYPITLSLALIG